MNRTVLICLLCTYAACAADLQSVKSESNLERRSEKALANANRAISEARDAYAAGDTAKARAALEEAADSVELSRSALIATGKSPRGSPKYFKRAELGIREMLRRLRNLEPDFEVSDRAMLLNTEERFQAVHDALLNGIMSKKK